MAGRRWLTLLILALVLLPAVACAEDEGTDAGDDEPTSTVEVVATDTSEPVATDTQAPPSVADTPTAPRTEREITYEIVERWDIPNGGEGKAVVISPDYLNDADMTALGDKLREDTQGDRNAFIFVYTDRRAAAMRDQVLGDEVSQADRDFYDQHFIGSYVRNANTGFHALEICFDGFVTGTNCKSIEY